MDGMAIALLRQQEDGTGDYELVDGVVVTFMPFIEKSNDNFKCFWAVLV